MLTGGERMTDETSRAVTARSGGEAVSEKPSDDELASEEMVAAINQRMPFGKYQGQRLLDVPEPYLVWFKQRGFPRGRLGEQMALVYEIRLNGLEKLVRPLLQSASKNTN